MKRSLPLIITLSILATGCAGTGGQKLPLAVGNEIRINNAEETRALLAQSDIVLVGPKANEKATVEMFMRHPMGLLSREPDESDFKRLGAALIRKTVVVTFPDGSTDFRPTGSQRFHMRQLSALATRVEISGYTSNDSCSTGSEWMAKERAMSAQRYLLGHNVPGTDMSISFMCAGGFTADNTTDAGRAENRRVQVKFIFEGDQA